MNSQADGLRARMRIAPPIEGAMAAVAGRGESPSASQAGVASPHLARTIAIGSGKGGVGKSTVALGLAWAAAERGVKTALVDADLGLANQDILCGVQPLRTAADWLAGRSPLAECFSRIAPRLWLLPGASGVARMADLELPQRERLLAGLTRVAAHVDLMIVDLGAGLGAGTLDIAAAADRLLVVCTPEPTSLADSYGLIKSCARRGRTERVSLVMNMVRDPNAAEHAAQRLSRTAARFLKVDIDRVGSIVDDAAVRASVSMRRPLLSHAPQAAAARAVRDIEGRVNGVERECERAAAPRALGGLFAALARSLGIAGAGAAGGVPSARGAGSARNDRVAPNIEGSTAPVPVVGRLRADGGEARTRPFGTNSPAAGAVPSVQ